MHRLVADSPSNPCSEVAEIMARMARNLAARGRGNGIDSIHKALKEDGFGDLTREELVAHLNEWDASRRNQRKERVISDFAILMKEVRGEQKKGGEPSRKDQRIQKNIENLRRQIRYGLDPKNPRKTQDLTEAGVELKRLRAQVAQMRHGEKLAATIDKMRADLASDKIDQYAPTPRNRVLTKEMQKLEFDRWRTRQEIQRKIDSRKPQGLWDKTKSVINIPRSILTSFDLSAPGRQGFLLGAGHPILAAKAFGKMIQGASSPVKERVIFEEIMNRPNAPLYKSSGLYLAPVDSYGKLGGKEEAFQSRWTKAIPGVAASERGYVTFLNQLRADSFDTITRAMAKGGDVTREQAQAVAHYINVATGRGGGSAKMDAALGNLNTVFFSPRYAASRFQYALFDPLIRGTGARKAIAKEYARSLIGMGVAVSLGRMFSDKEENDPRSSDFLKGVFGKTRVDLTAGLGQAVTFMSRMATGQTKTLSGQIRDLRGPNVRYGQQDATDVMKNFVRGKLAPIPATAVDMATGKDIAGETVTPESAAIGFLPIGFQNIYDAMISEGIDRGTALGLLDFFGFGISTYDDRKKDAQRASR